MIEPTPVETFHSKCEGESIEATIIHLVRVIL